MSKHTLANAAIIVALFVAIGPIVGLIVFASGMAIATASLNIFAFLLIYGAIFAHLMGGLPALIAGCLVACHAAMRGRVPLLAGALAGLFGMLGINDVGALLGQERGDVQSVALILFPAACVLSGLVCTLLARPWQQPARQHASADQLN